MRAFATTHANAEGSEYCAQRRAGRNPPDAEAETRVGSAGAKRPAASQSEDRATKNVRCGRREPGVYEQIGIAGVSKGGELALLLASEDPRIRAVLAFVPSSVVWQSL